MAGTRTQTGMALTHCILGKSLGVVCHCFPRYIYTHTHTHARKVKAYVSIHKKRVKKGVVYLRHDILNWKGYNSFMAFRNKATI